MFKVNKNTSPFYSVSNVDFQQVNVSWVVFLLSNVEARAFSGTHKFLLLFYISHLAAPTPTSRAAATENLQ